MTMLTVGIDFAKNVIAVHGVNEAGEAGLGRITKRGDDYLRTPLIQGTKSVVMSACKRSDRILWVVLTPGVTVNPDHVPERPEARCRLKPSAAP